MDPENIVQEEDTEALLREDPDLQYILPGADEEEQQQEEQVEGTVKPKPSAQPPAQSQLDDTTREILDQLKNNPDAVRRIISGQPAVAIPTNQPPPNQPDPNAQNAAMEAFAKRFSDDLLSNPETAVKNLLGAFSQMMQAQQRQMQEQVQQQMAPAMTASADATIQNYMDGLRNDRLVDDDVRAEMERLVETARQNAGAQISRMTPKQIRDALESAKLEAFGRVAYRRAQKKSSAPPPNYSGGGTVARPSGSLRLTEDERGLIRNLEAAKFTKAEIAQALKEYRAEKAG